MEKYKELNNSSDLGQNKDLYTKIRRNSLYILIERSLAPIINFLITVYIIRKLTVNDYGIYNILLAIMGYISLFSSFGLPNIFKRYIPEFYEKKQISNLKTLVVKSLILRFMFSTAIIVIILVFSAQIGSLFKFKEALKYLTIFAIAIIFYLQTSLLSITLTSIFHHKRYVIAQISYVLFRASIIYYLIKTGRGLFGLLIAESIAFVFLFLLLGIFYQKSIQSHSREEKKDFPVKRIVRFGSFDFFNEMGAQVLSKTTDYFVISAFLSPVAVGIYAFADRALQIISHFLPQSIFMDLIQPAFFTKYAQNSEPKSLNNTFNFLVKINAFFVIPLIMGVLVVGDKFILYVFGNKYIEALPVLLIFASFGALNAFQFPLGLVVRSIERVEINLYSKIFAIYNLVLDIIVVKTFGIIGVALVTSSAILFKNIFIFIFARRYTYLSICWYSILKIGINSFLMGVVLFFMKTVINNIYSFFMIIILGIIVYLLISYFNKVFNEGERKTINMILQRPIFVF